MERQLYVEYSYRMEGHFALGEVDTAFYKTLSGAQETYRNPETREPEVPIPSFEQVVEVVGKTLISSADIASCINAWLKSRSTKIAMSVFQGHQIEFEGPNLNKNVESITEMIDIMSIQENTNEFRISAVHIQPRTDLP